MERLRNRMMASPSKDIKAVPSSAIIQSPGTGGPSSFEMNQIGLCFWGAGAGAFGRQDGSKDHVGFQYQSGSFLAGADKKIKENLLLGGGISLSRTGFSWNDNLGDGNISQVNLGLYGSALTRPFFIDGTDRRGA
ncbi:MAG: autotransporter outer membrane beta-barrel domain-containing protein [Deltaproteobacteria bacterium]|nr:autotransporter outer membrane beta-barrel domain-containing protein [Deltaproteobacteria bacterium]